MKIVYMGTPDFAVMPLADLVKIVRKNMRLQQL